MLTPLAYGVILWHYVVGIALVSDISVEVKIAIVASTLTTQGPHGEGGIAENHENRGYMKAYQRNKLGCLWRSKSIPAFAER